MLLICRYLDFINVMTYDFHTVWDNFTGHNSPLYQGAHEQGDLIFKNVVKNIITIYVKSEVPNINRD